jgi:hypothetical protein
MSNVSDIYTGIKTQVQAALGSTYTPLTHMLNLEKNIFTDSSKRWAVIPGAAGESVTTTNHNTLTQSFKIFLSDGYITDEYDDSSVVSIYVELMGAMEMVYKQLVKTKCGSSVVVNLNGLSIDNALRWEEKKVILIEASFDVVSRISLT